jgi:hypothetical protein
MDNRQLKEMIFTIDGKFVRIENVQKQLKNKKIKILQMLNITNNILY